MSMQHFATTASRTASVVFFGALVISAVPAVVAQVGGAPGCNKEIINNDSIWDSAEGCEEWRTCDESESCATVPGGDFSDCGEPTCGLTSYCQTFYGGSYDSNTGLCSPDENTQPGASQPNGETHCRYFDATLCAK